MAPPAHPHITEISGIPMVWSPVAGRTMAALVFRVGMGDETLAERGLSHLREHLAIAGFERPGLQVNGFVDLARTVFYATGEERRIWEFIEAMTDGVAGCDPDRLDRERDVLRVESQSGGSIAAEHHRHRYGARGFGATAFPEYALRNAEAIDVSDWAERFFVRQNASIWATMRPPGDLSLSLAEGSWSPPISTSDSTDHLPGLFRVDADLASVAFVWKRSMAATCAGMVLHRRLLARLRHASGTSYNVQWAYDRTSVDSAHVIFSADCSSGDTRRAFDTLQATVQEFAQDGPFDDEMSWLEENQRATNSLPEADIGVLENGATALVFHADVLGSDDLDQQFKALRNTDLQEIVSDALGAATWQASTRAPSAGLDLPIIDFSDKSMLPGKTTGYTNLYVPQDVPGRLTYGPAGVRVSDAFGGKQQVRFEEAIAVLRWGDGTRSVVDSDGSTVFVEPTRWLDGWEAVEAIDGAVPNDRFIDQGFRANEPVQPAVPSGSWWGWFKFLVLLTALGLLVAGSAVSPSWSVRFIPIGIGLLLLVWLWADTRVRTPLTYESVQWRLQMPAFPVAAGTDAAANWGAPFLGWAIRHRHLSASVVTSEERLLRRYAEGEVGLVDVFLELKGILATDMFDSEANEFAHDTLLVLRRSRLRIVPSYVSLLDAAKERQRKNTVFEIEFDESTQGLLIEGVEGLFRRWNRVRWFARIQRLWTLTRTRSDRGLGASLYRWILHWRWSRQI